MIGSISDSKTLTTGDRRLIGRMFHGGGIPGFGIGTIFPVFHISGIVTVLRHWLKDSIPSTRYDAPFSPMCFIIAVARPSRPIAVKFLGDLMIPYISSAVMFDMSISVGKLVLMIMLLRGLSH